MPAIVLAYTSAPCIYAVCTLKENTKAGTSRNIGYANGALARPAAQGYRPRSITYLQNLAQSPIIGQSRVAQWIERSFPKRQVVGSNPISGASFWCGRLKSAFVGCAAAVLHKIDGISIYLRVSLSIHKGPCCLLTKFDGTCRADKCIWRADIHFTIAIPLFRRRLTFEGLQCIGSLKAEQGSDPDACQRGSTSPIMYAT